MGLKYNSNFRLCQIKGDGDSTERSETGRRGIRITYQRYYLTTD
jgi:hypothetical protein